MGYKTFVDESISRGKEEKEAVVNALDYVIGRVYDNPSVKQEVEAVRAVVAKHFRKPPGPQLAELVAEMRTNQKEYFATRKKGALIRSKELEKKVDELLKELK